MKRIAALILAAMILLPAIASAVAPRGWYTASGATDSITVNFDLNGRWGHLQAKSLLVYSDASLTITVGDDGRTVIDGTGEEAGLVITTIAGKYTPIYGDVSSITMTGCLGAEISIVAEY